MIVFILKLWGISQVLLGMKMFDEGILILKKSFNSYKFKQDNKKRIIFM